MKNLKKNRSLGVGLVVLLLAGIGFSFQLSGNSALSAKELSEYSGENIYTDLMFSQGKLATMIPEISAYATQGKTSKTAEAKEAKLKEYLISSLKRKHADFFPAFKSHVTSGDRSLIKETLIAANDYTQEALKKLASDKLRGNMDSQLLFGAFAAVVTEGDPFVDDIAILIARRAISTHHDGLQFENLVNSIALQLKQ